MREEYEQMELDTRTALDAAIEAVAKDSIQTVLEMIQKHHQQVAREAQTAPPFVRNRHEAYGIAAEQLVKINAAAEMRRTLDNLYTAELTAEDIITPLEAALAEAEFQEAEPADADSIEETETEDN